MVDKPFPPSSPQHSPGSQPYTASSADAGPLGGDSGAGGLGPRSSGQRSAEVRDAMAEMAERAQQISQEAGTKIAAAMKDVIGAAAGLAGFAVESARDLVQFMVRRGQMTQDEADKLIREAENAQSRRGGRASGSKAAQPEASAKLEKAAESGRREPAKAAATQAKRPSGASAAAKPEKKAPAKRDAAPKKPAAKSSAAKKRR